jgi:tetratricopeptide (TPR) repeat protein
MRNRSNLPLILARLALGAGLAMTTRIAIADVANPCPIGSSEDTIERCTETLASPQLSDEDRPYALWLRGWRYYQRAKYPEALADFDGAIKLIPAGDPIQYLQGALAKAVGPKIDPSEQEQHDEDADLVYPFGDFYAGRAATLIALNRLPEAVSAAEKAEDEFKSKRMDAYARTFRAIAYERMSQPDQAEKLYREAAELTPDGEPLYDLALLLLKSNRTKDAGLVLEKSIHRDARFRKSFLLLYVLQSAPNRASDLVTTAHVSGLEYFSEEERISDYFAGRMSLDDLMKRPEAYEGDDVANSGRLCEVHFFLGQAALSDGDKQGAMGHFKAAVATGADQLPEYLASVAELKTLKLN